MDRVKRYECEACGAWHLGGALCRCGASLIRRASAPVSCMQTNATTAPSVGWPDASGASSRGSRARASSRASAWDAIAGWSSARWPGSIAFGG
jgi:hypothetical protein